jgi:hypothetical protein
MYPMYSYTFYFDKIYVVWMNYYIHGMGAETPLRVEVKETGNRGLLVGGGLSSAPMLP